MYTLKHVHIYYIDVYDPGRAMIWIVRFTSNEHFRRWVTHFCAEASSLTCKRYIIIRVKIFHFLWFRCCAPCTTAPFLLDYQVSVCCGDITFRYSVGVKCWQEGGQPNTTIHSQIRGTTMNSCWWILLLWESRNGVRLSWSKSHVEIVEQDGSISMESHNLISSSITSVVVIEVISISFNISSWSLPLDVSGHRRYPGPEKFCFSLSTAAAAATTSDRNFQEKRTLDIVHQCHHRNNRMMDANYV